MHVTVTTVFQTTWRYISKVQPRSALVLFHFPLNNNSFAAIERSLKQPRNRLVSCCSMLRSQKVTRRLKREIIE